MYQYAKEEDSLLLSSFGADSEGFHFWDEYRSKHRRYDKLFNRMFNSFKYFMQKPNQTIAEITEDFTDEVYNHLMINAKKYEELYRVNVINDENYSILDNYNITETMDREVVREDTNVFGEREDTTESGARSDSNTRNYGAKETEVESVYGQEQTSIDATKGSQEDSHVDDIAGFNSPSYSKDTSRSDVFGERQDSSVETKNSHTDVETTSEGEQDVVDSFSKGQQTDTFTKGEQTDSFNGSSNEDYTLTRRGNIGVRTITEVIEYHEQFWTQYEFYTLIFKEICAELLAI